ncbi:M23/M56 family metallopeptidase [Janthinobacterium sp.]|uniref:M23/M56 family metallopeptidase n=1 Tax=Janthinobacterium sp. TaxID=1871054 RepID=UPI00293D8F2A|nr:M23/M56 family metallopeptidase [Janthinobacterium sp.]
MSATLLSLTLLHAALSCLLAGLLLCGALRLALRRWPALAAQRAVWLLAQSLLGAVFVLALLPRNPQWSVLPPLSLTAGAASLPVMAPLAAVVGAPPALAGVDWLAGLPMLWLPLYAAGLVLACLRLERARRLWRVLLAASRPLGERELSRHPAFDAAQLAEMRARGLAVRQTEAAVSPMLAGLLKPCLLLPRHLDDFSVAQQQMIIEHELTHWRRGDPLWQALALLLQTALWFNPALRWLGTRLSWAQELSCDRQVLAGRPAQQRQHYAAALVQQLKVQAAAGQPLVEAGLAFGASSGATMLERVKLMRQAGAARLSGAGQCALAAGMTALLAASVMLQPAFAWQNATPGGIAAAVVAAPLAAWRFPLERIHVNSFYGVSGELHESGHKGIDFRAAKGTPVLATAAGRVAGVSSDSRYGNVVVLEHEGRRRSLYAHLDSSAVAPGQMVGAGEVIGRAGETGLASGPHLHLEVFQGETRIDPQLLLPDLDGKAGAAALRARDAIRLK